MKKIVILLMFIITIILSLRINKLSNETPYNVNIRTSPYETAEIIAEFKSGEEFYVTKVYNKWVEINYNNKLFYTYREILTCTGLRIFPTKYNIPVKLDYTFTPDILVTETINIKNLKINKYWIQLGLLLLIAILILFETNKKVEEVKKASYDSSYPKLYTPGARTRVYTVKNNPVPLKMGKDSVKPVYDTNYKATQTTNPINEPKTETYNSNYNTNKKSDNKFKGDSFEEYIVEKMNRQFYYFEEWTSDKITKTGVWARSNKNPDLKFRDKSSRKVFYIECKYRSSDNIQLNWNKILGYKKFAAKRKVNVFMAIGTEGTPSAPKNLYLIPTYVIENSDTISLIKEKYKKKDLSKKLYFDPVSNRLG